MSAPREYRFREAVMGFFEFPTANAARLIPRGLQPVEPRHGLGVLGVTAFDFEASEVGPYREAVLSVLVSPRVLPGEVMPRSAMYPFMVGTTTAAARRHGREVWLLPHFPDDLEVDIECREGGTTVRAAQAGAPIFSLAIVAPRGVPWEPAEHRYQTFSQDDGNLFLSTLFLRGSLMESEEERGALEL
ncbi:MAG TPA: acetoacetate decarboxylase family protein, partial [Terriglobales bacterium]|nr:acetoacetate decarboxylase family protein [Terriglobales bacterium]